MLPRSAVLLDPTGIKAATFTDLAGSASEIPLVLVKADAEAAPLLNNRRVIEALQLQSSVLMLFESATEAAEFERAAERAWQHAKGARAAALAQRGRRFMSTQR